MTLDEFLAQIEARANAARNLGRPSIYDDVPTLLAMLRLAIKQRDGFTFIIADSGSAGNEAAHRARISVWNAELLKLAGGE